MPDTKKLKHKTVFVVGILLVIACIHIFRLGSYLEGRLYYNYYSYFSDIILPFGVYYLLSLNDFSIPFLRSWIVRAAIIFGLASFAEIMQGFGIHLLGSTFDPKDFVMYGTGVIVAVVVEKLVFERWLPFWKPWQTE